MAGCFFMNTLKRSIVYVDGFNLYYGALIGSNNKWLDLQRYFTLLRQADDIKRIRYFTALVTGPTRGNQEVYLRALSTLPLVEVRLGRFKDKSFQCRVAACDYGGRRRFQQPEEKQTDVAIGVQILEDAYEDRCDRFVVVSGDSDLLPAINAVKRLFPKKEIVIYVPSRDKTRGSATELRAAANKDRTLPQALLRRSQFAASIPDGYGGQIVKPESW